MRQLTNKDLFALYEGELAFHHHSERGLHEAKRVLNHFHNYLGEFPPSPELAKSFLSQFKDRKPTTIARYGAILKVFLKWYGEELDIKFKVPKVLPNYVPKSDIERLMESIASKKTHRKSVERDLLLIDLAIHTGLRRSELANLTIGDIDLEREVIIVRQGKGAKDRVLPLAKHMIDKLNTHIQNKSKNDSLFGLAPASISGKIKSFAKKAGVDIHAHSLRDYFATSLSEKGATIREIQALLGHTNLTHTERYTLHTDAHLRKAIELIDKVDSEQKDVIVPEQEQEDSNKWLVTIKGIYKDKDGNVSSSNRIYFSHFAISNEGQAPAIEFEVGLLNSKKYLLEGRRDSVLMIGEKIDWKPDLNRPDGQYHIMCQYKKSSSDLKEEQWNQTWLSFKLVIADKPGHYYVAPGQIVFKNNILPEERVSVF